MGCIGEFEKVIMVQGEGYFFFEVCKNEFECSYVNILGLGLGEMVGG